MKTYILENKQFLFLLLSWIIVSSIFLPAVWVVVPISLFVLYKKTLYNEILLGFLLVLIFSDSWEPSLAWAKKFKNVYIILMFLFYYSDRKNFSHNSRVILSFIPFILISIICLFFSESFSSSIQKTISYFLVIIVVTNYIQNLLIEDKDRLFRSLVFFVSLVFLVGFILYFINNSEVVYVGRYRGAFGNPNGLGVFSLIFFLAFNAITDSQPELFTKREKQLFYILLFLSMLMSGSRSAFFGVLLFFLTKYFYKKSSFLGFIMLLLMGFLYQYVTLNLVNIIRFLSLNDFFRINTIEDGSGRFIAWNFAWQKIQDNFFIGKGFDYTEYLFQKNYSTLSKLGHQGNAHNSFLTFWLDTGLVGLVFFLFGFIGNFLKAAKSSKVAMPIMYTIIFSAMFESWLIGSLNPITILVWIILVILLSKKNSLGETEKIKQEEIPVAK